MREVALSGKPPAQPEAKHFISLQKMGLFNGGFGHAEIFRNLRCGSEGMMRLGSPFGLRSSYVWSRKLVHDFTFDEDKQSAEPRLLFLVCGPLFVSGFTVFKCILRKFGLQVRGHSVEPQCAGHKLVNPNKKASETELGFNNCVFFLEISSFQKVRETASQVRAQNQLTQKQQSPEGPPPGTEPRFSEGFCTLFIKSNISRR